MPVTTEQREFWTQKNPAEEFDTIIFNHPEFTEPLRLVLNQFDTKTFNDNEYIPVAAEIGKPSQGTELIPRLSLRFSRIHVGDEFKKIVNSISPFGWQTPIQMIYEQYNEISLNTPTQHYELYVSEDGIRFNKKTVEVVASDDNPMILGKPIGQSNPIYTLEEYRGLVSA